MSASSSKMLQIARKTGRKTHPKKNPKRKNIIPKTILDPFKVIPFRITIPVAHVTDVEFARCAYCCSTSVGRLLQWPCHPQEELKQLKEQKELQQDYAGLGGEGLVMLSAKLFAPGGLAQECASPIQDWTRLAVVTVWYFSHVCGFVVKPSCLKCCMKATITLDSSAVRQSEM